MSVNYLYKLDGTYCVPKIASDMEIVYAKEGDREFFRRTLSQPVIFTGDEYHAIINGGDDTLHIFEIYADFGNGGYQVYWRGRFTILQCEVDMDACLIYVTPDVYDLYTDFLGNEEKEYNIPDINPFHTIKTGMADMADIEVCVEEIGGWYLYDGQMLLTFDTNDWFNEYSFPSPTPTHRVWTRQRRTFNCNGTTPQDEGGVGWQLLNNNCSLNGTAEWVRTLADAINTVSWAYSVSGSPAPPTATGIVKIFDGSGYAAPHNVDIWVMPTYKVSYIRGRLLMDIVKEMAVAVGLTAHSSFFEDAVHPMLDPVDFPVNPMLGAMVAVKTDVTKSHAAVKATRGEVTWKSIEEMLYKYLQCGWHIEPSGDMYIEHISYYRKGKTYGASALGVGVDLTTLINVANGKNWMYGRNRFKGNPAETPKSVIVSMSESNGRDFVGQPIEYMAIEAKGADTMELGEWSTDVRYLQENYTEVNKDGLVLLQAYEVSGMTGYDYECGIEMGVLSGGFGINGHMAVSAVQDKYHRWDRHKADLLINGQQITADGVLKRKQQEVEFPHVGDFDPYKLITTSMGNGVVSDMRINLSSRIIIANILQ